jgi:hypothetical protein
MLRLIQTVIAWDWPARVLSPLIGPFNPFHPRYRLEAQVAVNTLLTRFPDLEGETAPRNWKRSVVLRGPTALALRW